MYIHSLIAFLSKWCVLYTDCFLSNFGVGKRPFDLSINGSNDSDSVVAAIANKWFEEWLPRTSMKEFGFYEIVIFSICLDSL